MQKRRGRRHFEPLVSRMASERIMSRKRPLMAGSHNGETGDGKAFGQDGKLGLWLWERDIVRGQWRGPWRRTRYDR